MPQALLRLLLLLQQNLELLCCIYYQRKHINGRVRHSLRHDLEAGAERWDDAIVKGKGVSEWRAPPQTYAVERCVFKNGGFISGAAPLFGPRLIRDPDSAPLRLIVSDPGLVGTCLTFIGIVALYLPHR